MSNENSSFYTHTLSGDDWLLRRGGAELDVTMVSTDDWISATVPGNIQSDLENTRQLLPLWYGAGDSGLLDVCLNGWWYKKSIIVEKRATERYTLVFGGVDYACDIYFNDVFICHHEGMFKQFTADVTANIRPEEENILCIYIYPMPEELTTWLVNSDGAMSGEGTDYFFVEANNQIRKTLKGLKSPSVCSYDWGTNIYTLGIWRDVFLEGTGIVRADWLQVKTSLDTEYKVATIEPILELNSSDDTLLSLEYRIIGPNCDYTFHHSTELVSGFSKVPFSFELVQPALWWPTGYGEQPLYTIHVTARNQNDTVTFMKSARFGIRHIQWDLTEGAPENFPNRFALKINGCHVRTMGSNFVTPDLLPGRAGKRAAHFVELAKFCGMNTLRQHGGQPTLPSQACDAADEMGIMLFMDFPIGNCTPESDDIFLQNFTDTVSNIVKQYRNHPSIIEWSGGNELNWYFDPNSDHTALEAQRQAVEAEDDRLFRATCPIYGSRHAPWIYNPELHYKEFNRNITDNFGEIPMMRYGEFGCQTPANLESWLRDIPEASRWPVRLDDPILIRKNAVQAVFSPHAWMLLPTIENLFGPIDSIDNAVRAGQFLGAEGIRYMMDALRAMGKQLGGFTSWDYNEPWSNAAGSYLVDYDGAPVMAFHFARQALEPISLQLKYDSIKFNFFSATPIVLRLVSDSPTSVEGLHWKMVVRDRYGEAYHTLEGRAGINPHETLYLAEQDITPPELMRMGPVFCELSLRDSTGCLLCERLHIFVPEGVDYPLRGLIYETGDRQFGIPYVTTSMTPGRVRQTEIELEQIEWACEDNWEICTLSVKNSGCMTALFIHPESITQYRADIFVENDHMFIPPNESRQLIIRSHPSEHPLSSLGFIVGGWNTNKIRVEPDEIVLFHFGTKNGTCREYALKSNRQTDFIATERTIDTSLLYYCQQETTSFTFESMVTGAAKLTLAIADVALSGCSVLVTLNESTENLKIPSGYGIQHENPEHYAQPLTLPVAFDNNVLLIGENTLTVSVDDGWFSWDALILMLETI